MFAAGRKKISLMGRTISAKLTEFDRHELGTVAKATNELRLFTFSVGGSVGISFPATLTFALHQFFPEIF